MGAIGPGDWVECIAPKGRASPQRPEVVGGGIYQVDGLVFGTWCPRRESADAHPGVHLVGIERDPGGFCGCYFRPIYRPKADLIQGLLEPAEGVEA